MIDKYKTCKDCPDRSVRCHNTCEGYLERVKHNKELAERRRKEAIMKEYEFEKNNKIRIKATKDFQRSRNRGRELTSFL